MRKLSKLLTGAVAASLLTFSIAAPAEARPRGWRHHDGIDAGDVIAGVAIVGGIAALATALNHRDRYYDGRYGYDTRNYGYGNRYGYGGYGYGGGAYGYGESAAVNACAYEAQRYGGGRVSITDVDRRGGSSYSVYGVIDEGGYDRGGYGYDRAGFRCTAREDGRVLAFDFDRGRY